MLRILFFLCLIFLGKGVLLSQNNLHLQWAIPLKNANTLQIDKLGNAYATAKNILYKYDNEGKLLATFSENNYGRITHIDISNPLQLLVFYENYNKAIILDRTLSEMHRFSLQDLKGGNYISAIGLSSDNQIWIYDTDELLLQKIDKQGKILRTSQNIGLIVEDISFTPQYIYEYAGNIYVYDLDYGILVFDILANFIRKIEITDQKIFFCRDYLGYWDKKNEHKLVLYHLNRKNIELFSLDLENISDYENIILSENEQLFSLKKGQISCFLIKK